MSEQAPGDPKPQTPINELSPARGPSPSLARLAEISLRIGTTTFGGGYVTIGMLQRELVEQRGYLTPAQFDLAFALSRVTPGTILLAFCAAVGSLLKGFRGALTMGLGLTVPASVIAVIFIESFERWQSSVIGAALIGATVAAVAGMMWSTIYSIVRPHLGTHVRNLQAVLIVGGGFIAAWFFGVTPVPIIAAGALLGFLWNADLPGEPSQPRQRR